MKITPLFRCECGKLHIFSDIWLSTCTCGRELRFDLIFNKKDTKSQFQTTCGVCGYALDTPNHELGCATQKEIG